MEYRAEIRMETESDALRQSIAERREFVEVRFVFVVDPHHEPAQSLFVDLAEAQHFGVGAQMSSVMIQRDVFMADTAGFGRRLFDLFGAVDGSDDAGQWLRIRSGVVVGTEIMHKKEDQQQLQRDDTKRECFDIAQQRRFFFSGQKAWPCHGRKAKH